ncbi:MAG: pseudaminic acid biosynthesis-associated methylase [Bacteroidota bacterium]
MSENFQEKIWSGSFGKEYTDRNTLDLDGVNELYKNNFGVTRTEMNIEFLNWLDRDVKILEVGSNTGNQLLLLQAMGFENLYGIELQYYATEIAKERTKEINIIQGSAFDIPFKNGYFDLVFTSGVLIHISPDNLSKALGEINRCSKKLIWGFEYFAEQTTEISYRGNNSLLWKTNYSELYLKTFPALKLLKEKKYRYLSGRNVDAMFLLEKEQL